MLLTLPLIARFQQAGYICNHLITQWLFVPSKGELWKSVYSNPNRNGGMGSAMGGKHQQPYLQSTQYYEVILTRGRDGSMLLPGHPLIFLQSMLF